MVSFPGHEPAAPGHVFHAASLSLKRLGYYEGEEKPTFSQLVARAFDIESALPVFESRAAAEKY